MKSLGQLAFEAYNERKGGKTYDGKPIPPWDTLTDETGRAVQAAWEAAAARVVVDVLREREERDDGLPFGLAIEAMRVGLRVTRRGWNGRGMWLALFEPGTWAHGSEFVSHCEPLSQLARATASGSIDVGGTIVMRAADGSIVLGWLASQTDMLARDWRIC